MPPEIYVFSFYLFVGMVFRYAVRSNDRRLKQEQAAALMRDLNRSR